jgi:hypothetical protein
MRLSITLTTPPIAQHLDPVRRQRIDDDGMVDRSVRDVEAANPVGQNADPIALETPQHRARRIRAERGRGDPRLPVERLAERRLELARQRRAAEHGSARQYVGLAPLERRGHDDLARRLAVKAIYCAIVCGAPGLGERGGGKDKGGNAAAHGEAHTQRGAPVKPGALL